MGYFDLNIPYPEPSPAANKATLQSNRTKLAVKAMELGYTGIAYNRTIKGVMSDQHRCSISPLSLSSLLNVVPFLSLSAKLHRNLLGVPLSTPFRQYTRLTVCVDTPSQAQALNSGNPILKTYDLVAVKPSNQTAFDLACEKMEVDIISIDFSTKLPFRLKQPMVKAATQRGVCFEVTYSALFSDIQIRRQLISSAKLLMDWTRGQNIVFSSAAPSVNELRGPCDVANLLSLFGLSKERANAAISKNCRNLLTNSLRKKRFYKEAIRVEVLPSDAASHSKEDQYQDLLKWDPISSGEGDITLDDMEKSFSSSCKVSKAAKAIDFVSGARGFEIKDLLPANNAFSVCSDNKVNLLLVAEKLNQSAPVPINLTEQPYKLDACPEQDENSLSDAIKMGLVSSCDNIFEKNIHSGITEAFNFKEIDTPTNATKSELKNFIDSDVSMDNMAKSFLASCKSSKTAKAIDSVSVVESLPSHGSQIKDFIPSNNAFHVFPDNKVNFLPVAGNENQSTPAPTNLIVQPSRVDVNSPRQDEGSQPQKNGDSFLEKNIHCETIEAFSPREIDTSTNATKLELKNTVDSVAGCILLEAKAVDSPSDLCISNETLEPVKPHENEKLHGSSEDCELDDPHNIDHNKVEIFTPSMDIIFPALVHHKDNSEKSSDVNLNEQIDMMGTALPNEDLKIAEQTVLEFKTFISETSMEDEQFNKRETDAVELDEMQQPTSYDEMKMEDDSTVATHLLPEVIMEDKKLDEVSTDSDQFASVHSVSGRLRVKRRTPRGPLLFPFKRLLNPMPFKKKGKKSKSRTKLK